METKPEYNNGQPHNVRKECLTPFEEWIQPSGEEIRTAMKLAGLTGATFAKLVGISNSRTVRRWVGEDVGIPYSAWAILCYQAGFGIIWNKNA